MKKSLLILALGILSGAVFAEPELKGSPNDLKGFLYPTENIVTINGQAEEKAYSDKAIVSLVITTEQKLLSQAISENSAVREEIAKLLISAGLDKNAINSSKFSSSPEYGWFGSKPASYKVVNRMSISILSESHLKEIAFVADKFKQVELSDTAFEHTKKDEYNEKVKTKALQNIMKQKEFYEKTLGVELKPVGIRDSDIHQGPTRGALAMEMEMIVVTNSKAEKGDYLSQNRSRVQEQEPSFDEVKYQAILSVDFKIEQQK
jgi:uncharacterized protein